MATARVYKPTSEISLIPSQAPKFSLLTGINVLGQRKISSLSLATTAITDTYTTLYTVPSGKTFFLISAYAQTSTNRNSVAAVVVGPQYDALIIAQLYLGISAVWEQSTNILNLNTPIKFTNGEVIKAHYIAGTSQETLANYSVVGYELDNSQMDQLI